MDLGGEWLATDADDNLRRQLPDAALDERGWEPVVVPGHWRSADAFADSDGPLFYRRRFEMDPPAPGRRSWLRFDGIFYLGDIWLDGSYLGDTEGYFFPHTFEITSAVAERREHILAVEVACDRPADLRAKRSLTGIFQHWDCIARSFNPGGIWAPVTVEETGPVRISTLSVSCRDATSELATLDLEVELDTAEATTVTLVTEISRDDQTVAGRQADESLAAGTNHVRWRVGVERPALWWPHALGGQPLYDVSVSVRTAAGGDEPSDERRLRTGLRQVRMHNFIAAINGERLFLKGTNCGPTRRALREASATEVAGDVTLAREAGLDLLRIHAHIGREELYRAADEQGMLIWQDLPLQWGYSGVRRQAVHQARQAVAALGHHPSIAIWCGHNEPLSVDLPTDGDVGAATVARFAAGQLLPTWNKTILDRSIRRALEKADRSRPVVAHSGVLPHPSGGTDSHLYYGWYHGETTDLAAALGRLPVLARFVGEFGAQAVPERAEFAEPERWPDLDWTRLEADHTFQTALFERRVPPGDYQTFDAWRLASQQYQAELLRHHVETLRRLKYRPTGGFCQFLFADAQPAVSWSVLDHARVPKSGYWALRDACAPVIVVADWPAAEYQPGDQWRTDIHVVSDRRTPIVGAETVVTLSWGGRPRIWRFGGDVAADACVRVGHVAATFPPGTGLAGTISLALELTWTDPDGSRQSVTNRYLSQLRED